MRKKYSFLICDLFILAILSICSLMYSDIEIVDYNTAILYASFVVIIVFSAILFQIYTIKKNILDYNIIFLIFLFLFNFGQVFLYALGTNIKYLILFRACELHEIFDASIYFLYSILFYHLGFIIVTIKNSKKDNSIDLTTEQVSPMFLNSIRSVSILLLIVSVIPYNYILIRKFIYSVSYGYSYLYTNPIVVSNIITYISYFFVPSLFMLIYCSKSKIGKKVIIAYLLLISLINMITGARGNAFTIIVILVVFYYNFIAKINKKRLFKIVVIALIITLCIPILAGFRSVKEKNINALIEVVDNTILHNDNNFIVQTISELGYTMHSFILTKEIIPIRENYKYGESYIASLLMIIPSKLLGGYSFATKAALDIWLQSTLKMSYGPGYSLLAETYYNFGWHFGMIFSLVLGIFFTSFFDMSSKDNNKYILLRLLSLIFLYNSLILGRFPFHSTIRNLIYMYLLPYILVYMAYNRNKKITNTGGE